MRFIPLATAGILSLVAACGHPQQQQPTYTYYTKVETPDVDTAKAGKVPKDYKKLIDQHFTNSLKDPDSRKLTYGAADAAKPYSGLICGTVNAKNSYGGYTGQQPYYAVFAPNGNLSTVESFSEKEVLLVRQLHNDHDNWSDNRYPLLKACGSI